MIEQLITHNGKSETFKIPVQPKSIEMADISHRELVHLHSTLGPFMLAPEYKTELPEGVIDAVGTLVKINTDAFSKLLPRNSEGDTLAYQHCHMPDGKPAEPFFQVDMMAISQDLINTAGCDQTVLQKELKDTIFEFEPSIAMYELIQTFGGGGILKDNFRRNLDILRERHGKQIALLAPTTPKFEAVLKTEFGLSIDHGLSEDEFNKRIKDISGFDSLLGPDTFIDHVNHYEGECDVLLYVRPSDPISKLKDPSVVVDEPLLGDTLLRKIIRRNAVTLNIDNPEWSIHDPRRIKDSKAALPLLNMGHSIRWVSQINRLSDESRLLRAKPRGGVFGAYGQKTISIQNESQRQWLKEQVELRGPFIVQPEMAPVMIIDECSGEKFLAMDRLFFSTVNGRATFMGGIRILIPVHSNEARNGRLHGSNDMISAPIIMK